MPPAAPQQDETVIDGIDDAVAKACADRAGRITRDLNLTELRVVITKNQRWGTIWRADHSFPHAPNERPFLWRTVCWSDGTLERPLEMFDSSQSIPPLP
jgi:hypothetical protein